MEPSYGDVRKTVYSKDEMKDKKILYITDVEGNDTYFEHIVKRSKGLFRDADGKLELRSGYFLVYGGDVCDRGKGDLRITSDLVQLTKKYPDRVHIILGNRDINKIRLCTELQAQHLKTKLKVFWIDGKDLQEPDIAAGMPPCSRATRLHTILEGTMGAPGAFQYRIEELLEMGIIQDHMSATEKDQLVVESFLSSMEPGGCMLELLRLGTLGLLLGDVFFFHGGVHEASLGWVPPSSKTVDQELWRCSTVQEWCHSLALFHQYEMNSVLASCHASQQSRGHLVGDGESKDEGGDDDYIAHFSTVGGYDHPEAGSRLMQYGMGELPDGISNPTVIYDNFLAKGAPQPPSEAVIEFLNRSGVVRTVTGHQPHGDAPVVISLPTLQVLTGDTSYAHNVEWDLESFAESAGLWEQLVAQRGEVSSAAAETRGYAVSEIVISFDGDDAQDSAAREICSNVLIHGVTESRFAYEFSTTNELIGRCFADDWWVKSLLHLSRSEGGSCGCGGAVYMLSKSSGRDVLNTFVTEEKLRSLLVKMEFVE